MAWSEAWKARLSDDQMAPIILVDVGLLSWAAPEFAPTTIGGDTFSSQPHVDGIEPGHLNGSHLVSDLRTNGQSVRLRDWTVNTGGFSFALTSTKPGEGGIVIFIAGQFINSGLCAGARVDARVDALAGMRTSNPCGSGSGVANNWPFCLFWSFLWGPKTKKTKTNLTKQQRDV